MAQPAGGDCSHVIEIDGGGAKHTEPLANQPVSPTPVSHIIDVDVVRPEQSECAVCMEPLEWVAIGPCGHREVCSNCAVQIRVRSRSRSDRRCSICRKPCPTVVVTKSGGERHVDTKLAPLGAFQGRVGEYWYHNASAAYFDDEGQFEAARKTYLDLESVNMQVGPCDCCCSPVARILLYLAIVLFVLVIMGVSTGVINVHQGWGLTPYP